MSFLANQKILMFDGTLKEAFNIAIGDKLIGPGGDRRIVNNVSGSIQDLIKITPVKGSSVVVGNNQQLSLVMSKDSRRNGQLLTIAAIDFLNDKKIQTKGYKIYRSDSVNFQTNYNQLIIDPYFLGVLIGDGGGFAKGYSPNVTTADSEIVDLIFEQAKIWGLNISDVKKKDSKCSTYRFVRPGVGHGRVGQKRSNHQLKKALFDIGFEDLRCENRFIPIQYKLGTSQDRLNLLGGLLDTDGEYGAGYFSYCSKSETLADDIVFLSRSLGFASYKTEFTARCQNNFSGQYFKVSISGECSTIATRIARKKASKRLQCKNVLRTGIKSIEQGNRGYCYQITADCDNLYLLDDFTVVHGD